MPGLCLEDVIHSSHGDLHCTIHCNIRGNHSRVLFILNGSVQDHRSAVLLMLFRSENKVSRTGGAVS